jgi:hypothetical protein
VHPGCGRFRVCGIRNEVRVLDSNEPPHKEVMRFVGGTRTKPSKRGRDNLMETLAFWVLWVCMSDCGVVSETRIQPGLTAAQCVRFLDFYEWQQRAFVNDARETKSSRSLKSTMTPNEAQCISPSGKTYSTGRWILNDKTNELELQQSDVAELKQWIGQINKPGVKP